MKRTFLISIAIISLAFLTTSCRKAKESEKEVQVKQEAVEQKPSEVKPQEAKPEVQSTPEDAYAYNNRGIAYAGLGDYQRAINDYKIAARLGLKPVQDYLRSKGIDW